MVCPWKRHFIKDFTNLVIQHFEHVVCFVVHGNVHLVSLSWYGISLLYDIQDALDELNDMLDVPLIR